MRDLHFFRNSPHRSPRSGDGVATRGVSEPISFKFRANFYRISFKIELTNGQIRSFYTMSFVQIMTWLALIGQQLPVERHIRILDVMLRQRDFVMDDVPKPLSAGFTHSAIDPLSLCDVSKPA